MGLSAAKDQYTTMTKNFKTQPRKTQPLLAGLLAWLVPGAGHWYVGRPERAAVLFLTIQSMFWAGMAVGGVFTVNPREEIWWTRAQLCSGTGGLFGYIRKRRK